MSRLEELNNLINNNQATADHCLEWLQLTTSGNEIGTKAINILQMAIGGHNEKLDDALKGLSKKLELAA
ncbi:hypothetical protein [Vibrio barjaei]|uniref:hypothetical protein n=1 Tax=Vibrio barjaei TaxID=1676683 RepID=UPI00228416DF|nr:hypothetical protein [Vibrio barjaei]MCY9874520.1 hypothetical protein [Vibrio barjaei]